MAILKRFTITFLGLYIILGLFSFNLYADLEEDEEEIEREKYQESLLLQEKQILEKEKEEQEKEQKKLENKNKDKNKNQKTESKINKGKTSKNNGKNKQEASKLKWESSSLKADKNNKKIYLIGKVKLSQEDLIISSDKATIHFENESQVSFAEASGNVKISKGQGATKISSKSGEAVFDLTKRKIILSKNPILWKNTDVIKGKVITYEIDSGMVTVSKVEGILDSLKDNYNEGKN